MGSNRHCDQEIAGRVGARCTLAEVMLLADFEQPPNHDQLVAAPNHVNVEVAIDGYGSGRVALIALAGAEVSASAMAT